MPLDPVELSTGASPRNTPEYIDENPNRDLVLEGMEASEDEQRDAADELFGEDPSLPVSDDLDEMEDDVAPEIAAIHFERIPDGR
ncbi:MAG TPA: hypothetical protein VM511_06085 [Luteolibacter sp.]|nr:hypothetical protein [Luteolibacter sp.]